ncbi:RNA polymerase sigma factor [Verrucomicrobiales bacterium]|nr:RNA polymerase sigma factor [Verrucomicrobiales bacterium]
METETTHQPDYDRLVPAVRGGDESAATALVEALYPVVIRIVRSHLPRATTEEDVAQEVFLKVFSKIGQFRGDRPFDHWVSRIATNTCYDLLRKQRVRPLFRFADLGEEQATILENSLTAPGVSPESLDRGVLDRLLATLNPRQELVIRLLDLEELSVEEICNQTGWGASKVKVTAMRARKKLASTLEKLEAKSKL